MLNATLPMLPRCAKMFENLGGHIRKRSNKDQTHETPPNIVKFRLNGFALDAEAELPNKIVKFPAAAR